MKKNPGSELLAIERVCQEIARITKVDELKDLRDKIEAIHKYERARGASVDGLNRLTKHKLRVERRLGALNSEKNVGRPTKDNPPRRGQFSSQRISEWRKLSKIREPEFEAALARAEEEALRGELTTAGFWRAATHSSGAVGYDGDEWYTPSEIVDLCREVLGSIDVDPASNEHAQKTVKARMYYTKQDSGLDKEWHGSVFCNPPYSTTLIKKFTNKLIEEYESSRCTAAIYLVNNCTDAGWFHQLLAKYPACFTRGRISFCNKAGEAFATRQGQAIFYLGDDVKKFVSAFSSQGIIVRAAP